MPRAVATALVFGTLLSACRKKAEIVPQPEQAPVAAQTSPPAASNTDDAAEAARRAAERERAERERLDREARERSRAVLTETVLFEFDRSDLSETARSLLDAKVDVMKSDMSVHIRVDGHADERGSDEYNLALSMRRASAARRYLTQHGIGAERIEIVGVGEERPVCQDSQESCWRRNRRAEFAVVEP